MQYQQNGTTKIKTDGSTGPNGSNLEEAAPKVSPTSSKTALTEDKTSGELLTATLPQLNGQTTEKPAENKPTLYARLKAGFAEQKYSFVESLRLLRTTNKQAAREQILVKIVSSFQPVAIGAITGFILDSATKLVGGGSSAAIPVALGLGALYLNNVIFGLMNAAADKSSSDVSNELEAKANKMLSKSIQENFHAALKPEFAGKLAMVRENLGRVISAPREALETLRIVSGSLFATVAMTQAPWPVWALATLAAVTPGIVSHAIARHWRTHEEGIQHTRRAYWIQNWAITDPDAIRQLKILDAITQMRTSAEKNFRKLMEGNKGSARLTWLGSIVDRPINALCGALAIGFMLRECALGQCTIGQVSFIGFSTFSIFSGALTSVVQRSGQLIMNAPFIRAFSNLTQKPASDVEGQQVRKVDGPADLTLDALQFTYASDLPPIFKDLSLHVAPGEIVAFWGRNGCGKTTLFETICGNLPLSSGRVLLDGTLVGELSPTTQSAEIGYVLQRPILFGSLTVLENLELGRRSPEPQLLDQLCRCLGVTEMLAEEGFRDGKKEKLFPLGLETVIGGTFPNGVNPSPGQAQMLSIVRALYRRPRLLVVDEPTAALDSHQASKFMSLLTNLTPIIGYQPTILMITHNHYRVRMADRIVMLSREHQGIVEVGSHEELMAKDGLYAASMKEAQLEELALTKRKSRIANSK